MNTSATHLPKETNVKASVFIGTSVDCFIARRNGELDFLPPGGGEPHGYAEFMDSVDALVIGRKTYETVLGFEAWPYGEKPVFVLSSRSLARAPAEAVVEHLCGDPAQIMSDLDARGGLISSKLMSKAKGVFHTLS